jgi:hypothetical protein
VPQNLTEIGQEWLEKSGLRKYVDDHKNELMKTCEEKRTANPYEIQKHIFKIFDDLIFDSVFEDNLKRFAFEKGTSMNIMRRIAAIHFRNLCLGEFKMKEEDVCNNSARTEHRHHIKKARY